MTHLLSILIFWPILCAFILSFLPSTKNTKYFALAIVLVEFLFSIVLYLNFNAESPHYQFVEKQEWIKLSLGNLGTAIVEYHVGIDGISLPLVLLTALITLIAIISSFTIDKKETTYYSLFLLLLGSLMGCFLALDFFLFFLFFEFMLLPMYFLIGIWGGERREYAAIKFFLYTMVGSVFILIVMIGLYLSMVDKNLMHSFDLNVLSDSKNYLIDSFLNPNNPILIFGISVRNIAFWLLFLGFAIKLPIVPLHTWLPDAHVEAPTPVSVVLAAVLLKVGGYGFIRILLPIFPDVFKQNSNALAIIATISIIYGGLNALAQSDLKKMIAYSSVSHIGFVLLGIASYTMEGMNGALYQMVSHGILSALLFLIVGVLYDRTHDRIIQNFRGLAKPMPQFTVVTAISFFASLGLPAFSGFVGELFTLMGSFNSVLIPKWLVALATLGIIISAGYFLWTFQRMFLGEFWQRNNNILPDLSLREKLMLYPLVALTIILGLFPQLFFNISNKTFENFLVNQSVF